MGKPKLPPKRATARDAAAAPRRTAKAASEAQAAVLGRAAESRAPTAVPGTESVAVPAGLLRAARERTGFASDSELVRFALVLLAEADSGEDAFNAALGSLPGHTLEY